MTSSLELPMTSQVSNVRRTALRACYLLMVVGLGATAWPRLLTAGADRPVMDAVVDAVLCGFQLLALLGLFAPVKMLTVLVFDVLWKVIWVAAIAVPRAVAGTVDQAVADVAFACAWAVPFVFIIPWRLLVRGVVLSPEPVK